MLDAIKKIAVNMLTGASIVTSLFLIAVGYSDRLSPVDHPLLACLGMAFPFFILANLLMLFLMLIFKWKRVWVPIFGFALAYVPIRTYIPLHFSRDVPQDCIKVLSYNVCGYGGNYRYEKAVDTVASYIRRIDADIVCLQEDHGGKGGNPVEALAQIYPYNDTTQLSPGGAPLVNCLGIHTRYPIIRKERLPMESQANGSVAYFLQVGADTLIVINNHLEATHLSVSDRNRYKQVIKGEMEREAAEEEAVSIIERLGDSMAKRAPQADILNQYIEEHAHYPIILCGDFNDTPISYVRRVVSQNLTDCFVESGCGLGLSFNQKGFNFRIDHIMCSSHFEPYNCMVDDDMDASDHYPIMCWLKMRHRPSEQQSIVKESEGSRS